MREVLEPRRQRWYAPPSLARDVPALRLPFPPAHVLLTRAVCAPPLTCFWPTHGAAEAILRVGLRDHLDAILAAIQGMLANPEVAKLGSDPDAVATRISWLRSRSPPPGPRPPCTHGSDAYVRAPFRLRPAPLALTRPKVGLWGWFGLGWRSAMAESRRHACNEAHAAYVRPRRAARAPPRPPRSPASPGAHALTYCKPRNPCVAAPGPV